ncbi:hypothetical protein [Ornithinibacillus halotolerans]|uniref:Uncharacterized protein n=1 Tax=Ornithinibacillus halotolerans TaxID=1274357 RepID=A0A916RMY4_9BACI|nr:hypothetical protein [Ornithinibacillus halotolerans]GGA60030.1 hypothetical protein GCM10008025_00070 [Ornithinibacillus halotolerans]
MKNAYLITVHILNLLLLAGICFVSFFLVINITPPGPIPNFGFIEFSYVVFLFVMWGLNYWFQYKKRNWILPFAFTILFIVIALLALGVVVPLLRELVYS